MNEMMGLPGPLLRSGWSRRPEDLPAARSHLCGLIAGHQNLRARSSATARVLQSLAARSVGVRAWGADAERVAPRSGAKAAAGQGRGAVQPRRRRRVHGEARCPRCVARSLDVQASYDGDPAAEHTDEVILYPGLDAIFSHRLAHELYNLERAAAPADHPERALSHGHRHPPRRADRAQFLHRPRLGHGHRRDERHRRAREDLPGRDARRAEFPQGRTRAKSSAASAPPDHRQPREHLRRRVILGGDTVIGDDCVIAGGVLSPRASRRGTSCSSRAGLPRCSNAPPPRYPPARASGQSRSGAQANTPCPFLLGRLTRTCTGSPARGVDSRRARLLTPRAFGAQLRLHGVDDGVHAPSTSSWRSVRNRGAHACERDGFARPGLPWPRWVVTRTTFQAFDLQRVDERPICSPRHVPHMMTDRSRLIDGNAGARARLAAAGRGRATPATPVPP